MFRILLQPIQRTIFTILSGGRKGQFLQKRSDAQNDFEWVDSPAISQVNPDSELNINSTNAISNQAVTEHLTWHEVN